MRAKAILLLVAVGLIVGGCGVKNDLARPDGKAVPRDEPDPSKPPYPVGR